MTADAGAMKETTGSRPVPDPTELTDRAIARLEKSLTQYIDGQLGIRDTRFDAIDKATIVLHETVTRTPTEIQKAIDHLTSLTDEKFSSVAKQFAERDTRSERESRDNKVAVDAAFAAQKEAAAKQDEANAKAIDKSERATAETIKTNQELNRATTDGLTKSLDEVKLSVTKIESTKVGASENRTGMYATIGVVGTILGILIILSRFLPA